MAVARDSAGVGRRHDDEKLRRCLRARAAGDLAAAHRWWEELITDNFDRVRGMVAVTARGHLSADEQEDATQRALVRMATNMFETFNGTSMGEWVEATRTLVKFACMDQQRRAVAVSRHEQRLELHSRDGDDSEPFYDKAVMQVLDARDAEQAEERRDEEARAERRAFLDWAVPQLSPRRREVVELDRLELGVDEIARRLAITRDVVYASRHRAVDDLRKLYERYEP